MIFNQIINYGHRNFKNIYFVFEVTIYELKL